MRHAAVLGLVLAALAWAAPAGAKVLIVVDKSSQQMNVSVDGVHRWTWPVSTGVPRYDTPSGQYRAFRMEADHFSKEWDDAPMPHSIFFTRQGHAIHGYLNTRNIGNPASHGCVRLSPGHAARLYALVQQQGVLNTTVVLTGDVRVAMAHRPTRTVARDAGTVAASGPLSLQPDGGGRRARYGHQPPAADGRIDDNCPPPPPGFPMPACATAGAHSAYAPRYDDARPRYRPEAPWPLFGYSRAPGY